MTAQDSAQLPADLQDERLIASSGVSGAVSAFTARLRSGDLGSVPVVVGLVIIWVVFQIANSSFLSSRNLVNLTLQTTSVGVIALGIVLVLLLGEIDLSVGSVSGVAAALVEQPLGVPHSVVAELVPPQADRGDPLLGAGEEDVAHRRLLEGDLVQAQPVGIHASPPVVSPAVVSRAVHRRAASSGSRSSPASLAPQRTRPRCSTDRADSMPPSIRKCSCSPLSQARKTIPVL